MPKKSKKPKKIFVLDTSVILHDHNVLDCLEENDIAIPITVLEELDNFKRGNDIVIKNIRKNVCSKIARSNASFWNI